MYQWVRAMTKYYVFNTTTNKVEWSSSDKKECKAYILSKENKQEYIIFKNKWHRYY